MAQMKDQIAELDDSHLDRVTAIIRSMTPAERANPKIINGSRRARSAAGSGDTVMDVNQLMSRFSEAQKMMRQMGGMMGLPGSGKRTATKSPKNKRKAKKGGSRARGGRGGAGRGPGGVPAGGTPPAGAVPHLPPPGLDPGALTGGLDGGFTPPKLDFGGERKRKDR